jgi:type VI secretion system secreted protein VgrG
MIHGSQSALVVGPAGEEIHTDKYARVKVHFYWDRDSKKDEKSSCWIRVATPWGGKGYGSVSIPRIGNEVLVAFEEGDPDRPIIIGSVYNADQAPPFSSWRRHSDGHAHHAAHRAVRHEQDHHDHTGARDDEHHASTW